MLRFTQLDNKLEVTVAGQPPPVGDAILADIENIWQAERQRQPRLFNGSIFSISALSKSSVTGWMAEYRWLIAQQRDRRLKPILQVRPLAVSGMVYCDSGLVFGRRAAHLESDSGLWELVPSGGVDGAFVGPAGEVDLAAQLVAELAQEVGIGAADLFAGPQAVAIVEDDATQVTDVAMLMRTKMSSGEILDRFASTSSGEYDSLRIAAPDDLAAFGRGAGGDLSAVSRMLLQRCAQNTGQMSRSMEAD